MKRSIIFVLLLAVLSAPLTTQAIVAPGLISIPTGPTVPTSNPALETKETGYKIFGFNTGISWDTIAINIAKKATEKIVDSTVNWINSGFNDNPAYVTDPAKYFADLSQQITDQYIDNDLKSVCATFQQSIQNSIRDDYRKGRGLPPIQATQSIIRGNPCGILGLKGGLDDFYNDFSTGGWDSWFEMTQNSELNPYSAYLDASTNLSAQIASNKNTNEQLLDWGRGFLSYQDETGTIRTPGAVIESQLETTLGTGIRQLELADEFDELISALLGQLSGQIFSSGGLLGTTKVSGNQGIIGGGSQSGTAQVSCVGLPTTASIGDPVSWRLQSSLGENATYTWSGTDFPPDATGTIVNLTYGIPGTKTATVTATAPSTLSNPNPTPVTIPCGNNIIVSRYKPLTVACYPTAQTANFDTPVEWTATITGGSGEFSRLMWSGGQDFVPGTNGDSNKIWPDGLGVDTNDQITKSGNTTTIAHFFQKGGGVGSSIEKLVQTVSTAGTTTQVSIVRPYYQDKDAITTMDATVTVIDKDPTLGAINQKCPAITIIKK